MVVLVDEKGLSPADEDVYRKLLDNLRADTPDKMSVQDFLGTPEMRSLLESKDKKAWNLPITIPADAAMPAQARSATSVGHRQEDRRRNHPDGSPQRPPGHRRRPAGPRRGRRTGHRDRHHRQRAAHLDHRLPKYGHHAGAAVNHRCVGGGRTGPVVRAVRAGLGREHAVHRVHERGHDRGGNGLCRLSDQPISRLRAARRHVG